MDELGDRDRRYIESMIEMQRRLAVLGRILLLASRNRGGWWAGTSALSAAKILENMEIGHNVMHGQWDWMNDPRIHSSTWDWDTASTAEAWKHSHNYVHHTYTNIRGKDKDLGYEIMRIDPQQSWHPVYLAAAGLQPDPGGAFRVGRGPPRPRLRGDPQGPEVDAPGEAGAEGDRRQGAEPGRQGLHRLAAGQRPGGARRSTRRWRRGGSTRSRVGYWGQVKRRRGGRWAPVVQAALEGGARTFRATAKANATANIVRNVWAYAIIFCGHFPDQTYTFSPAEVEDESRGGWYIRQLTGSANIEGGPMFHVASGNLGYQVEHHLFPDMPSSRYAEIAPQVKDVCERYGLPYNSGPFSQQLGMVQRTILRLAFPGGRPRPKPGPYRGENGTG